MVNMIKNKSFLAHLLIIILLLLLILIYPLVKHVASLRSRSFFPERPQPKETCKDWNSYIIKGHILHDHTFRKKSTRVVADGQKSNIGSRVQWPAGLYCGQEHKKMNIACFFFFNWLSCPVWKCLYSSSVFYIYSHFPSSVSNYKVQAITCYPGKQRRGVEKERGKKFSRLFFCCGVSVRMKSWPENARLCTNPCGNCLCQFIRLSMWTALIIRSLPGDGLSDEKHIHRLFKSYFEFLLLFFFTRGWHVWKNCTHTRAHAHLSKGYSIHLEASVYVTTCGAFHDSSLSNFCLYWNLKAAHESTCALNA